MNAFELKVQIAYNLLCKDIAASHEEIRKARSTMWTRRLMARQSAISHLAVRCIDARRWRNPYGLFNEDSTEFFYLYNGW